MLKRKREERRGCHQFPEQEELMGLPRNTCYTKGNIQLEKQKSHHVFGDKDLTSAPIGALEVKLEIMTDKPIDQPTNRQTDNLAPPLPIID